MKDWEALVRLHFIFAAHESGLLKALTTPCGRKTLIKDLNVERPDLLDAFLDVGLATKELGIRDQMFFIRGKRSKAVATAEGDMLAAMIQANMTYYNDAYRQAAHRLQGGELGDDLHKFGGLVARFSKMAEPIMRDFLRTIVAGRDALRILDVGCGHGFSLRAMHDANRAVTGVGLDIDESVVRQAQDRIAEWGLGDSFSVFHGDILDPPGKIEGPFDLITLFNVLYYFDDKNRVELLRNLCAFLSLHGRLAIAMTCHSRGRDVTAANLNMVNCSLKGLAPLPDLDDIKSLLRQCGFRRIEVHRFIPGGTFFGIIAGPDTRTHTELRSR